MVSSSEIVKLLKTHYISTIVHADAVVYVYIYIYIYIYKLAITYFNFNKVQPLLCLQYRILLFGKHYTLLYSS